MEDKIQRTGLDSAEFKEVVHQLRQPLRFLPDRCVVAVDGGRFGDHTILQRLAHGPDSGDGRAEIVRYPGHQFTAGWFLARG